ncbi:hypothetical protein C8J57DRAFT_1395181 [Mycena rebaudengoi]|nr:hypothetical protein C8J57DRAFT_1395181 [Mycena rebaudengoi]
MLRATPGLVECTLIIARGDDPRADSLTLPCLRSLSLGEEPVVSDIYILKFLSLPALHTLSIPYIRTEADVALLISFLARLETPLQSLRVGITYTVKLQSEAYTRLLDLVPTLKCLWLTSKSTSECMLISNLLRRSPQGFIPELRDLTFVTQHHDTWDFQPLYDLLSAWHSQIKSFQFFIEGYNLHYFPPPPDLLHRLRQLAAECGMNIHFGTMDTNYI